MLPNLILHTLSNENTRINLHVSLLDCEFGTGIAQTVAPDALRTETFFEVSYRVLIFHSEKK